VSGATHPFPTGFSRRGAIARFTLDRSAAVSVLFAIMLPALIGFMAVGIEGSMWFYTQQKAQTAADAAALAGALEIKNGDSTHYVAVAKSESQRNQIQDGVQNQTVTINYPPASPDAYHSNATAVQAIVTKRFGLLFSALVLGSSLDIRATAVAASVAGTGNVCILGLNKTANNTVEFSGASGLDLVDCAAVSDSSSTQGFTASGGSTAVSNIGYFTHASVFNFSSSGMSGPQTENAAVVPDPDATAVGSFPPSTMGACAAAVTASGTQTLSPGTYGGITIAAGANVTMSAGTYYLDANSSCAGNGHGSFVVQGGTVTGTGVTIVLTNSASSPTSVGQVTIQSGTATLSAPTGAATSADPYPNFLFIVDNRAVVSGNQTYSNNSNACGNCKEAISGSASTNLTGIMYFPNDQLTYSGGSSENSCLAIIADIVTVSGSATMNCTGANYLPTESSSNAHITLVE